MAIEPVVLLGISILQDLDGVPDRQAVEMLRYHASWNFALNRQLGDRVFHATTLVNFRSRLEEHDQSALGFTTILEALVEAGLVSRQSRQRLDSTQMFGRVGADEPAGLRARKFAAGAPRVGRSDPARGNSDLLPARRGDPIAGRACSAGAVQTMARRGGDGDEHRFRQHARALRARRDSRRSAG